MPDVVENISATMSRLTIISFAVIACMLSGTGAQTKIPVSTRYITTSIETLSQGQSQTFIASLCEQFKGETVNATILLNNNPEWDPNVGVMYYYIVDDPSKTQKDALCNNTDKAGNVSESCIIPKWPGTSDLYLKAKAGSVAAISFSIDIDFQENAMYKGMFKDLKKKRKSYAAPRGHAKPSTSKPRLYADAVYLTEIVTVETSQRLQRIKEPGLLEITFCPNPFTTEDYEITSTVFGTDGISSYTQYVCEKLPCVVDGANVVTSNGKQLPNNAVRLATSSGQYSHIYVLLICWAGQYDPAVKNYVGEFQYSGSLARQTP